jgi:hypothetical protein
MELDFAEGGWHLSAIPTVTQTPPPQNSIPMEIVSVHLCSKTLFLSVINNKRNAKVNLTLSNLIFLPTAYSPALICFGW